MFTLIDRVLLIRCTGCSWDWLSQGGELGDLVLLCTLSEIREVPLPSYTAVQGPSLLLSGPLCVAFLMDCYFKKNGLCYKSTN